MSIVSPAHEPDVQVDERVLGTESKGTPAHFAGKKDFVPATELLAVTAQRRQKLENRESGEECVKVCIVRYGVILQFCHGSQR